MNTQRIQHALRDYDRDAGLIGDGLLTDEEAEALAAGLPRLAKLAAEMKVDGKPVMEWERIEILRFLSLAIRLANPIRLAGAIPFNDSLPFDPIEANYQRPLDV